MNGGLKRLIEEICVSVKPRQQVAFSGRQDTSIASVLFIANNKSYLNFEIPQDVKRRNAKIISEISKQIGLGVPIYGTTTSYGGRAGVFLNSGTESTRLKNATDLSRSIVHVDVSTGPILPVEVVRAAIAIRINMLLPGFSGIRIEVLDALRQLLNKNITPIVGSYGSVGASGDLAQNGRIVSALLALPSVYAFDSKGRKTKIKTLFKKIGIEPVRLAPKEGLALVNGDNFSSATAVIIADEVAKLLLIEVGCSALFIQSIMGSSRNFHPLLSKLRPHEGQEFVSGILRNLLDNSSLAKQDLQGPLTADKNELVQDPYSIRCLPQYLGSDWEILGNIWKTLTININSVSDNPVWTTPETVLKNEVPYQWVSGGNFMAMHVAESLDMLRKILVHLIKLNDRHLARLVHPKFNKGLPANLSGNRSIGQLTFKGLQTQMGMFDVYSSLLVSPASTAFSYHEEFNQDITSHAPSSGILARELLRVAKLAIATNLIAVCQAIDLRGGPRLLSGSSRPIYDWVRSKVSFIRTVQPLGHVVELVAGQLMDPGLIKPLLNEVIKGK